MASGFLAIICSGLILACYGAQPWFIRLPNIEDHLRHKRDTNDIAVGINSADECPVDCHVEMSKYFKASNPNQTEAKEDSDMQMYDANKLDKLCTIYNPTSVCLKNCADDGDLKKKILDIYHMLEFLCVTNYDGSQTCKLYYEINVASLDTKKYMPCIKDNKKAIDESCDPQCKKYEHVINELKTIDFDQPEILKNNFSQYGRVFEDSCTYMKCSTECSQPLVNELCGQDAGTFFNVLIDGLLDTLNKTTVLANEILEKAGGPRGMQFSTCQVE